MSVGDGVIQGWPVAELGDPSGQPVDAGSEEFHARVGPKEILFAGTVDGVPWLLQWFEARPTRPSPVLEAEPYPILEFFLGKRGEFGGSVINAGIASGSHLSVTRSHSSRLSKVVTWVGVVSEATDWVQVRSELHTIRLKPLVARLNCPPLFFLFAPADEELTMASLDSDGNVLEERQLPTAHSEAGWHSIISTDRRHGDDDFSREAPLPSSPGTRDSTRTS